MKPKKAADRPLFAYRIVIICFFPVKCIIYVPGVGLDILKSVLGASLWYRIRPCKSISVTSEPTFAPWIAIKCGSTVMRNFAGSLSCSRPVLLLELDLVDELDFILFELLDFAELDEYLSFWKLEELIESTLLEDFALMELLLDPSRLLLLRMTLEELLDFAELDDAAELLDFAELDEDLPFWKLEELIESTLLEDFALMELLLDPIATLQDDEERSLQDDEEGLLQDDEEESAAEDDEDEFVANDDKTVLELEDVAFEELTYMFFVQKVSGSSMNAFANF